MENKMKNNGMLVGVLIGIIVMLLVGVGLFVTGTISFNSKENINTHSDGNQINKNSDEEIKETVLSKEEAILKVKEVYKKFNNFDSISLPSQFCGDSELNNPNGDVAWYVKSKQFKNKEEAYSYYNTFVSKELIDKKVLELESGIEKSDKFPSAILEKDGVLYCWCKATGGFNSEIIDDKTTYEITEITTTKITFTGIITKYEGYDDIGQPYNIEATLELVNNNWIITQNIKK